MNANPHTQPTVHCNVAATACAASELLKQLTQGQKFGHNVKLRKFLAGSVT